MEDERKTATRRKFATGAAAVGAAALFMTSREAKAAGPYFSGEIAIGLGGTAPRGSLYSDQTWGMLFRARHEAPTYLFGWALGGASDAWPGYPSMLMETNGALSPRGGFNTVAVFVALGSPTNVAPTTDETVPLQAAIDSLGDAGGTVLLNPARKYLVGGTLAIKPGVTLAGHMSRPDLRRDGNGSPPAGLDLLSWGSHIVLGANGRIVVNSSGSVRNLVITNQGITSLPLTESAGVVSGFSATKTAVTLEGEGCMVRDVFVGGFNIAVHSKGSRPVIDGVFGDNYNGVVIDTSDDTARISNCHFWPFLTAPSQSVEALRREGAAFKISSGEVHWTRFDNCFSYGYKYGFWLAAGDLTLLSLCGADNTGGWTSYGYYLTHGGGETRMDMCQASANVFGVYSNIVDPPLPQPQGKARLFVTNSTFVDNDIGLETVSGSKCTVRVLGCTLSFGFHGIRANGGIGNNSHIYYGDNVFFDNTGGNISVIAGASATSLLRNLDITTLPGTQF